MTVGVQGLGLSGSAMGLQRFRLSRSFRVSACASCTRGASQNIMGLSSKIDRVSIVSS